MRECFAHLVRVEHGRIVALAEISRPEEIAAHIKAGYFRVNERAFGDLWRQMFERKASK